MVKIDGEKGVISISTDVFTILAGDAANNCFGVKGMAGRAKTDGLVHLLRRESMSKGVRVRFEDDNSVSIELHIVVEYGVNLTELSKSIMGEVSYKVSQATGVPVKRVDIYADCMLTD